MIWYKTHFLIETKIDKKWRYNFFILTKKKRTCSSLTEGGAYPQHPTHPKILYTFQTHIAGFFDQVGHQTMSAYIENKLFSLNHVIVRLTKIMNRADVNWANF